MNYANVLMGLLTNRFLNAQHTASFLFKPCIDDILMIWQHGRNDLQQFIDSINEFHPTIKFTISYSAKRIAFLVVKVTISQGNFSASIYQKPADMQKYLSFKGSYPRHSKVSIPYSKTLRYRGICSDDSELGIH